MTKEEFKSAEEWVRHFDQRLKGGEFTIAEAQKLADYAMDLICEVEFLWDQLWGLRQEILEISCGRLPEPEEQEEEEGEAE